MPFCDECGHELTGNQDVCEGCGARVAPVGAEAADAGTATASAAAPASGLRARGMEISRIVAGVWLVGTILFAWFSAAPGQWAFLLWPTWIGALLPLIRNSNLTGKVDRWEEKLLAGHSRAAENTGKFARYFKKPLYGGGLFIWKKTRAVGDAHLRAGLRVTALSYFATVMIFLLVFVGYILIAIVIAIAIIFLALWALSGGLKEKLEQVGSSNYEDDAPPRVKVSRPATDLLGNPKMEHFDERGKKVGETRPGTDLLGNPVEEHFDRSGRKIGESRDTTGFLGDPKTEHFDARGEKTGESRPSTDFLGDPELEHFDEKGKKTGESRPDTDILGNPVIRHEAKE